MKAGEIVQESDLHMLSPGDGFKWAELSSVVGKTLAQDIPADEIIYQSMLK
jgi:sialic acid synthase